MSPGSWVELGDMMMLAQTSRVLEDIAVGEKARKRTYQVDEDVGRIGVAE